MTVGFLVLGMFFWQWGRAKPAWMTPIQLIVVFVVVVGGLHAADARYKSIHDKTTSVAESFGLGWMGLWILCVLLWMGVLVWLVRGIVSSALAPVVEADRVCRGLGDGGAAGHARWAAGAGGLGPVWGGARMLGTDVLLCAHCHRAGLFRLVGTRVVRRWLPARDHGPLVKLATALFVVVSLQLFFGAIIRHTQRGGLVATDIITTAGQMIPPFQPFTAFSIFMHKCWALVVFSLSWAMAWHARRILRGQGWVAILPKLLAVLPVIQVTLGVYVLLTSRKFWVTNFHVLNGLFILGSAFLLMIVTRRSRPMSGLIAGSEGTKSGQNASSPLQAGV